MRAGLGATRFTQARKIEAAPLPPVLTLSSASHAPRTYSPSGPSSGRRGGYPRSNLHNSHIGDRESGQIGPPSTPRAPPGRARWGSGIQTFSSELTHPAQRAGVTCQRECLRNVHCCWSAFLLASFQYVSQNSGADSVPRRRLRPGSNALRSIAGRTTPPPQPRPKTVSAFTDNRAAMVDGRNRAHGFGEHRGGHHRCASGQPQSLCCWSS
jgi:hypothetical protein